MHPLPMHRFTINPNNLELKSIPPVVRRWIFFVEIISIVALCLSVLKTDLNRIHSRSTGDFEHFFYAAEAVYHGQDPYAAWTRGYIYPPLIAFLFQPLAPLGRDNAAGVMLIINVAVTLLAVWLASDEFLRRFSLPGDSLLIAAVMLLAMLLNIDKIKGEWQMWQTDVFMLLLFVLALRWLDRRPLLSGLALGIAINIKYLPLLFIPYLLIRRRFSVMAWLIVWTVLIALLPAVSTGWNANMRNWRTATNGLLQMADARPKASDAAEVHDVKDSLSCSITSALARAARTNAKLGFALAAFTALSSLALAAGLYHLQGRSIFSAYYSLNERVTAVEWVMLVAVVLCFGPQTNTRHLFDALIFTAAASAMLLVPLSGNNRVILLAGTAILFFGFILPPGSRSYRGEMTPTLVWLRLGGPCWCFLIAAFSLLWTGLSIPNGKLFGRYGPDAEAMETLR